MPDPLAILAGFPAVGDVPLAALALEHMPISASIVSAIRDDDGVIEDFCIEYSNLAASATSPDRTETYGKPLFEVIPAFQEVGLFDRFVASLETGEPFTQEGVRLTGTYGDIAYDVRLDVVGIPLGENHMLSVSHDRTAEHETSVRLTRVQETLGRREQLERQITAVNAGLIEDLLGVQRALDVNDTEDARRHARTGIQRAAEVVTGLRDVIRTGA
ncbi:MAG: sensor hybrid histidine kinase [Thermoleophilia bacterium]|nr:sensor hybrid histidine kinase [Thermoleophilia bacterium]